MQVVLHKGSWCEFKIALALHLKDFAKHWDSNISRKIFMILQGEEIRERFLSAFPPLRTDEKLDLSLDEIINPIEILEEKSHTRGCHPGRLTLDPDRYHRAFTGDDTIVPHHMRAGFISTPWGKHRLLDRNENHNPHLKSLIKQNDGRITWGLQDLYFMGGVPLMYWCRGDSMGMWVPHNPPDSRNFQWTSTVFYPEDLDEDMGRTQGGRLTYCFKRMWYLPTEMSWWGREEQKGGWPWIPLHDRRPRTCRMRGMRTRLSSNGARSTQKKPRLSSSIRTRPETTATSPCNYRTGRTWLSSPSPNLERSCISGRA